MQFRRQLHTEDSINLTPLIDVVFLLLIFFMVSTTFTKETHLAIDLPEADAEADPVAEKAIDIVVSANGDYKINGQAVVNQQANTLHRALATVAAGDVAQPLVITADASASHQAVVRAMDVAGQLGFKQLRITTQQPAKDE
ncbi:MAG: biopolymer transporter ExbD [Cellvibrionaceae bacterium]|nr:biopolymer transporter ExbD [Cellvibrionaceae bacterium]